jgi:F-type H+-transporting ATPase subunit b
MVDINWTVIIQIIDFVLLIFILNFILYKPIRNIIQQRKAKIEGLNTGINKAGKEVGEKGEAFAAGIKEARAKGQKAKETLLNSAAEEQRNLLAQINAKAKEDLDAVKTKITQDAQTVKTALEREIDQFATAITQKILGRAAQ